MIKGFKKNGEILKYDYNELGNMPVVLEPLEDDIPKVFIDGMIPTTKNDVLAEMTYVSKTERFHAYLEIKCQGSSSMSYDKKNFTIKMYSDEARTEKLKKVFKDWGYQKNKYVLKANFIDHSHARNIVSARLWDEVVASRSDYNSLPKEFKASPQNGAIDGFPIKLYANGTYQGIYTWNIGKDDWLWNMDEDNTNHVLMCGETNTNDTYAETPCNFRALWSGVNEQYWSIEVGTNSDNLKNSLNALITCVKDTDDETFMATIENHLDLQSTIDYWIHQYVICGLDGLAKNMLLGTYDLQKWIMGAYDMDSTFGLWWRGDSFVSSDFRCPEDYQEKYSLLFERITSLYSERVKERYAELRRTVYSTSNMFTHFERFMDVIGKDLYAEDLEVYATIPSGSTNNIKQIRNYIKNRLNYCDMQFGLIEENVEVDYTLNPLANVAWVDGYTYDKNTGAYTVGVGEHCTPKFKLQNCVYEFDFTEAGTYGSLFVWDENGNYIANKETTDNSFCFVANSKFTYAIKVQQTSAFDTNSVSLMPKDNRENAVPTASLQLSKFEWTANSNGVEATLTNVFENTNGKYVNVYINSAEGALLIIDRPTVSWDISKESDVFIGSLAGSNPVWLSTKMFTDVDSAMAYFREHNTTIIFNAN